MNPVGYSKKETKRRIEERELTLFKNPPLVRFEHRYTGSKNYVGFLYSISDYSDEKISQGYTCFGISDSDGGTHTSKWCELVEDKETLKKFK